MSEKTLEELLSEFTHKLPEKLMLTAEDDKEKHSWPERVIEPPEAVTANYTITYLKYIAEVDTAQTHLRLPRDVHKWMRNNYKKLGFSSFNDMVTHAVYKLMEEMSANAPSILIHGDL